MHASHSQTALDNLNAHSTTTVLLEVLGNFAYSSAFVFRISLVGFGKELRMTAALDRQEENSKPLTCNTSNLYEICSSLDLYSFDTYPRPQCTKMHVFAENQPLKLCLKAEQSGSSQYWSVRRNVDY